MSNVAVELQWWQRWDGTSVECIDDEPECFSHYQQSCYTVSNKLSMYCTSSTHGMLRHMSDEMKKLQSLYLYNFALRWIINRGYTYLYSFFLGIGMYRARSLYRGTFDIDVFCYVVAVEMVQVQINFWNIIYGEICSRNPNSYEPVLSMVRW